MKLGKYRNYKGNEYEVLWVGNYFTDGVLQKVVVYKALYDSPEFGHNAMWVRPYEMFESSLEWEGKIVKRYEYIG